MEKCTFCVQRIRGSTRAARAEGKELEDGDRALSPACVNACPTDTLVFGDLHDPESRVSRARDKEMAAEGRGYHLFEEIGTHPNVIYLKKVDHEAKEVAHV